MSYFEKNPQVPPTLHPLAVLYGSETGTAQVGRKHKPKLFSGVCLMIHLVQGSCLVPVYQAVPEQGMQQHGTCLDRGWAKQPRCQHKHMPHQTSLTLYALSPVWAVNDSCTCTFGRDDDTPAVAPYLE